METTNTIIELINSKETHKTYEGLQEAADLALSYLTEAAQDKIPFSQMIKGMPKALGYTLHPESFITSLNFMLGKIPSNKDKREFVTALKNMDDLDILKKAAKFDIQLKQDCMQKYAQCEMQHNKSYSHIKPYFPLITENTTPTVIPKTTSTTTTITSEEIKQENVLTATKDTQEQIKQKNVPISTENTTPTPRPVDPTIELLTPMTELTPESTLVSMPTSEVTQVSMTENIAPKNKSIEFEKQNTVPTSTPDPIHEPTQVLTTDLKTIQPSEDITPTPVLIPTPTLDPTTITPEEIKQENVLTAIRDTQEQIRQINVPTNPISPETTSVTQAPALLPKAPVEPLVVPKDTYITLPAKDPEPNHPDESGGISLEFDTPNKQILLYTVIVFLAIRVIAYYYKDDSEKSSENTQDEALNSAYETVYLDPTLLINILISLIPIWLVIIYKLRYYYYYKFLRLKKTPK